MSIPLILFGSFTILLLIRVPLAFALGISTVLAMAVDGELLDDPQIAIIGLPVSDANGEPFQAIVEDAIEGVLDSLPRGRRRDPSTVREAVRRAVRNEVTAIWGKKPAVAVLISTIEDE